MPKRSEPEKVPCPGCGASMTLDQEICRECLRPRDELEIERGHDLIRDRNERKRRRPYLIARGIFGTAAFFLACRFHGLFLERLKAWRADYLQAMSDAEQPKKSPPAETTPISVPRGPSATASAAPAQSGGIPVPSLNPASQWAFYGRVYDLITLRAVVGARLNFKSEAADVAVDGFVTTDQDGRFSIILPRVTKGSFSIRSSHPAYSPIVLYEADIPYAKLSAAERGEIAAGAQDPDETPPPLTDVAGEDSMRRDLFLAPRR